MLRLGIDLDEDVFYTSALATAHFLAAQRPGGTAYIIGEAGLINALYNAGYTMNNYNPDYVVVGDTRSYSFEKIEQAVNLVLKGAKLIGTNPDLTGPVENGIIPATKALIAPIELAAGRKAYFVGKPNPLMMRIALKKIGCSNEETVIIGDRMDTDIIAGIESEIDTLLVLTGISTLKTVDKFPYRPAYILDGVADLVQ
jgi:NagD protein